MIGRGGMGTVYLAYDKRLERDVALKVLPEGASQESGARYRLRTEALALSKLNHPNIAHVYDFDVQNSTSFLVMEYVEGETLGARIGQGPLSEEGATNVGIQIATALEAAGSAGLVHRDIKPANVILTPNGQVKLLDFGLAKLFGPGQSDVTQTRGDVLEASGTLPYMAPEQLQGSPADFRSDIYSLGAVLYESVTARRPFGSHHSGTLIADIISKRPELPHDINPTLSQRFEAAVMRCLAKEPAQRYQSATELRTALEALRDTQTDVRAYRKKTDSVSRKIAARVALGIVVLVLGVFWWKRPKQATGGDTNPNRPAELAVLPIETAGIGSEADAFDRGLVETLTSRLTQLGGSHALEVVPASEMRDRKITSLQAANEQFGATLGLKLNVERSGEMVRVNYALVDAKQHKELHGETITSEASDPFALEDKVAESVVKALQIELRPEEKSSLTEHGTTEAGALDYYLQGRGYLLDFQKPENVESAIAEFNHAVEKDPNYALAYAGLGEAFWRKYQFTKDAEWVARAKSSCERAVSLRGEEAAGHNCLGLVFRGTGEFEQSIAEYKKAAEIDPTDDRAYEGQALAYVAEGKAKEAEATLKLAVSLRPNYWSNYNSLGDFYLKHGRFPEAEAMFMQVTELVPDSFVGYGNLGNTYLQEGEYAKAVPMLERSVAIRPTAQNTSNLGTAYFQLRRYSEAARTYETAVQLDSADYEVWGNLGDAYYWAPEERGKSAAAYGRAIELANESIQVNPRNAELISYIAGYYAMSGQHLAAVHDIQQALQISPDNAEVLASAAQVYKQLGETDECLRYLEKAVAAGYSATTIRDTPNFDSLHGQERFERLAGPNKISK